MDLNELRRQIDAADDMLLTAFLARMDAAERIGLTKMARGLPVENRAREEEVLASVEARAGARGPYARELFETLFRLSKALQTNMRARAADDENIVLIGMPGAGKTVIGKALACLTGRCAIEIDDLVEARAGMRIPELFASIGETGFRALEIEETARAAENRGAIIVTGGGVVVRAENRAPLCACGRVYHIERDIALLAREGRPLSQNADLYAMYKTRAPLYARFRDAVIQNDDTPERAAERILLDFCGCGAR